MRKSNLFLPLFFLLTSLLFSCSKRDGESNLSESIRGYELEILDSVMVDYIGVMSWSHISPDQKHFLAMNLQTKEILLIDTSGKILQTFLLTGDQPNSIGTDPIARPQFKNAQSFAVLGINGFFEYDLSGKLVQHFKPDFSPSMGYMVYHADLFQFKNEDEALALFGSRKEGGLSFYSMGGGTILEKISLRDKSFTGVVPFPNSSRFGKNDEIYTQTSTYPVMRTVDSGVYVAFTNEPTLYYYAWDDLENPSKEIPLKFESFEQIKGKDPKAIDLNVISFDTRTFAYGSINHLHALQNKLLIGYEAGLTDEVYERTTGGLTNFQEIFTALEKVQIARWVVASEDGSLTPINTPSEFGKIEFIDAEGNLWFSPNKNEKERDYEVIFKAQIRPKK
jgi:hypothetical protein